MGGSPLCPGSSLQVCLRDAASSWGTEVWKVYSEKIVAARKLELEHISGHSLVSH